MAAFAVGELFFTFASFQEKLNQYSKQYLTHFYIKDSKKFGPTEASNPLIVYKHINYCCIYGGQKPRFRGTGTRTVSSIRHGCPVSLYLRATKDKSHLQVRQFIDVHNHSITEELYKSAVQEKKLPEDIRAEVEDLLLLGADKDRLCEYIQSTTKKILDRKNLFNIHDQACRQNRAIPRDRAISLIEKVYGVRTSDAEYLLEEFLQSKSCSIKRSVTTNVLIDKRPDSLESQEETTLKATDDSMERIVAEMSDNDDGEERIVILEDGQEIQLVETDGEQQYEEYLSGEGGDDDEMVGRSAHDEEGVQSTSTTTMFAVKEEPDGSATQLPPGREFILSQARKRKHSSATVVQSPRSAVLAAHRPTKTVLVRDDQGMIKTVRLPIKFAPRNNDYEEVNVTTAPANNARSINANVHAETQMFRIKSTKLNKEITKLEIERTKLLLEIDLLREEKKLVAAQMADIEAVKVLRELKTEKLKLEIDRLKRDNESNKFNDHQEAN